MFKKTMFCSVGVIRALPSIAHTPTNTLIRGEKIKDIFSFFTEIHCVENTNGDFKNLRLTSLFKKQSITYLP